MELASPETEEQTAEGAGRVTDRRGEKINFSRGRKKPRACKTATRLRRSCVFLCREKTAETCTVAAALRHTLYLLNVWPAGGGSPCEADQRAAFSGPQSTTGPQRRRGTKAHNIRSLNTSLPLNHTFFKSAFNPVLSNQPPFRMQFHFPCSLSSLTATAFHPPPPPLLCFFFFLGSALRERHCYIRGKQVETQISYLLIQPWLQAAKLPSAPA